jgi:hypothetical protein
MQKKSLVLVDLSFFVMSSKITLLITKNPLKITISIDKLRLKRIYERSR